MTSADKDRLPAISFVPVFGAPHQGWVRLLDDDGEVLVQRTAIGWINILRFDGDVAVVVVRAADGTVIAEPEATMLEINALQRWLIGASLTDAMLDTLLKFERR